MNRSTALAAAALAAVLMAGCASPGYGPGYGSASPQPVAGQAYPSQGQPVYPGQAQQPYTVAYGAVGNRMEDRTRNVYQIGVRLDNGSFVTITQDSAADLQVGSRVRIDNNNRVYRY